MGILVLAIFFGGAAAVTALIAGHSFLMALAIYSGCGVAAALVMMVLVLAGSAMRARNAIPQPGQRARATV